MDRALAPALMGSPVEIDTVRADQGQTLGYVRVVGRRGVDAALNEHCSPDTLKSFPMDYERKPLLRF
jgi:hypothetical protein